MFMQGFQFKMGDLWNGGNLSVWRDAAGNVIMQNGLNNFRSIYNDPFLNINAWSVNQLKHEQNDPTLQVIHQQYLSVQPLMTLKPLMESMGGVNNLLSPSDRISAGCVRMGYAADCGGAR